MTSKEVFCLTVVSCLFLLFIGLIIKGESVSAATPYQDLHAGFLRVKLNEGVPAHYIYRDNIVNLYEDPDPLVEDLIIETVDGRILRYPPLSSNQQNTTYFLDVNGGLYFGYIGE